VSTGDGVALALRAGAAVTDIEFVQFHPTALYLRDSGVQQQPLITEALRGEGAYLRDGDGKRFMVGQHDLAELAPRDVVAKGIHRVMRAEGSTNVWLDATHLGAELLERRFPTIVASSRAAGVDPVTDLIPVAPAAHYASGGVRTDLHGHTSIPGLYACGEVACTGVHGANRLASNSLLEGLVFARRIAVNIAAGLPPQAEPVNEAGAGEPSFAVAPEVRAPLQAAMSQHAGVLRSESSLDTAAATLVDLGAKHATANTASWEASNLITVASALLAAAGRRQETRGCHWREDFPEAGDAWQGHLLAGLDPSGRLQETWEPRP
jgi:L-aspartate oxidase